MDSVMASDPTASESDTAGAVSALYRQPGSGLSRNGADMSNSHLASPHTQPQTSDPGSSESPERTQQHKASHSGAKRNRALLSCGPCRASKQKCDRAQPCSQCLRKGRTSSCIYAGTSGAEKNGHPAATPTRAPRSMASRLKRLEAVVRALMDSPDEAERTRILNQPVASSGDAPGDWPPTEGSDSLPARGQVVVAGKGEKGGSTTYVGATHFMAVLDDIEDLKSYFDEGDEAHGSPDPEPDGASPENFLLQLTPPKTREEFLAYLPPKRTIDLLTMRFFNAFSPSQHIVHRPTFARKYAEFWQDPSKASFDLLALLFIISALGTYFSSFLSPDEADNSPGASTMERFYHYRSLAASALVSAKFASPGPMTMLPMLLYLESEFIISRASQMNCYLMSAVCMRLMLKMGLHRDPSNLPNISPFDGEMRRRMWNLGVQIELMVAFHLGLPSMVHGIESDTALPGNLLDEDFSEDSSELPPARPDTEYTLMTYPIWKTQMVKIFGLVARQAHSLSPPTYAEVLRLDHLLEEKWSQVPAPLKIRPLEDCVIDPPHQVNQRFGIASLYQKSRCVLHRRYLVEPVPKKEHEYSRRTCLEAALRLLEYQDTFYRATLPGGILRQHGWFLTSLAIHDFLLAAMIVYLVLQNGTASALGADDNGTPQNKPLASREELCEKLKKSRAIWLDVSRDAAVGKKAADILEVMLNRIGPASQSGWDTAKQGFDRTGSNALHESPGENSLSSGHLADLSISEPSPFQAFPSSRQSFEQQAGLLASESLPPLQGQTGFEGSWLPVEPTAMDWTTLDSVLRIGDPADNRLATDWASQDTLLSDFSFSGDL
ncbi:hypothetical protein VTK73DRAFT_4590 [Phialemonium thermophilum]|uniref:Zn(2)-C6 fungal-type domain-containing protein n=1 Tax=Phialemonium thermophilum TaxID=223376 RepID=A0ABR3XZY9_9PEZI